MKANIFISHSSDDSNKMKALKGAIKKRQGLNPIVIAERRSPGKSLAQKVIEGIWESDYVVPILTDKSIKNQWVNQEIGYAKALGRKIYPIIDKSVLKKLKGFVHSHDDQPYKFDSSKKRRKEASSYRRCYSLLLDDIMDLEGVKEKEQSEETKQNLDKVTWAGYRPVDVVMSKDITDDTMFNLRVRLSSIGQTFIAYYRFETDRQESKWIGYTNGEGGRAPDEYTEVVQESGQGVYSIDRNVIGAVKRGFPDLHGTPARITGVRFRADRRIPDAVHFFYAVSESGGNPDN